MLHSSLPSPPLVPTNTGELDLECQGRAAMPFVASSCPFSSPTIPEAPPGQTCSVLKDEIHPQTGKLAASQIKALHIETNPCSSSTATRAQPCPAAAESITKIFPLPLSPSSCSQDMTEISPSLLALAQRHWELWGLQHRPDDRADASPDLAVSCSSFEAAASTHHKAWHTQSPAKDGSTTNPARGSTWLKVLQLHLQHCCSRGHTKACAALPVSP